MAAWIEDHRGRLDRGELAGIKDLQLMPWLKLPDVERFVERALRDVDMWRASEPHERLGSTARDQQRLLAQELSALHERLVEGKPCPEPGWSPTGPPQQW